MLRASYRLFRSVISLEQDFRPGHLVGRKPLSLCRLRSVPTSLSLSLSFADACNFILFYSSAALQGLVVRQVFD